MGTDVLCQAKSGMGKTAVFVLSILQQIKVEYDEQTKVAKVGALVMAHTRELAFQVSRPAVPPFFLCIHSIIPSGGRAASFNTQVLLLQILEVFQKLKISKL